METIESLFLAKNTATARMFIEANTSWKRASRTTYLKDSELIHIVTTDDQVRGRRPFKAYYSSSMESLTSIVGMLDILDSWGCTIEEIKLAASR